MKKAFTGRPHRAGDLDADALLPELLAFLADDPNRLTQFLTASGLDLAQLRDVATEPGFYLGLLDFLCANEPLLIAFAAEQKLTPESLERERQRLSQPYPSEQC